MDFYEIGISYMFLQPTKVKFTGTLFLFSFILFFSDFNIPPIWKDLCFFGSFSFLLSSTKKKSNYHVLLYLCLVFFIPWLYLYILFLFIILDEVRKSQLFYKYKKVKHIFSLFSTTILWSIFESLRLTLKAKIFKYSR